MTLPTNNLGKHTTADEAIGGRSLAGKRAVVTGGASGIGKETVRALVKAGCDVVIAARDTAAAERVVDELRRGLPQTAGKLEVRALDLADLPSVRTFADGIGGPIDILICNAGVMASPHMKTKQGFELQMGTNHLGHFLLVNQLLPKLAPNARVVVVASGAHTRGTGAGVLATLEGDRDYKTRKYTPFGAYGDAKLANILFARALAKRLPAGTAVFSLHPGVIPTPLTRHMGIMGTVFRIVGAAFMKTTEQGAATSVYAATAPGIEQYSGIYLSDCNEKQPIPDGRDDALAEKVWQISEKLVAQPS